MSDKHYLAPKDPSTGSVSIGEHQIDVINGVADVTELDSASRALLVSVGWRAVNGPNDGAEAPPAHTIRTAGGEVAVSKETLNALQILQAVELLTEDQMAAELTEAGAAVADASDRETLIRAVHALRLDRQRAEAEAEAASSSALAAPADGGVAPPAPNGATEDGTIVQTDAEKVAADAAAAAEAEAAAAALAAAAPGAGGGGETEAVSPRRKRQSAASFEQ